MPQDYMEIQLDKSTLPQNGQTVFFSIDEDEEDLKGEYIAEEKMFWIDESNWHYAWKVIKWRSQ